MGDRVAVLNDGVLQQVAPPKELYNEPVNEFVAGFIGSPAMNIFDDPADPTVRLGVRPEHMHLLIDDGPDASAAGMSRRTGTVSLVEELGSEAYVYLDSEGVRYVAKVPQGHIPRMGDTATVAFDGASAHRFSKETGERIVEKRV